MTITLPKEAMGRLPAPDSGGLIRVTATLKLLSGGKIDLAEIDGSPVKAAKKDSEDDENPMPAQDLPDLDQATSDIYQP